MAAELESSVAPGVIREANAGFLSAATGEAGGSLAFMFNRQAMEQFERLADPESQRPNLPQAQKAISSILSAFSSQSDPKLSFADPELVSFEGSWLKRVGAKASQASAFVITVGEQVKLSLILLFFPNVENETVKADLSAADPPSANTARIGVVKGSSDAWMKNISRLFNVEVDLVVRFGATTLALNEIIRMGIGSMLELNRAVDEPVEILVNDQLIARGEVVVIDGYYGVRISEIISTVERTAMIA
jgi:flagellar motor switch protein FliN